MERYCTAVVCVSLVVVVVVIVIVVVVVVVIVIVVVVVIVIVIVVVALAKVRTLSYLVALNVWYLSGFVLFAFVGCDYFDVCSCCLCFRQTTCTWRPIVLASSFSLDLHKRPFHACCRGLLPCRWGLL